MTGNRATLVMGAAIALMGTAGPAEAQMVGAPYADANYPTPWAGEYLAPMRGTQLEAMFLTSDYIVSNEAAWGLPTAPAGLSWVRYWDDAVLVDRDGVVREVRAGLDWEGRAAFALSGPEALRRPDSTPFDPRYSAVGTPLERMSDAERTGYWERHSSYPPRAYATRDGYVSREVYEGRDSTGRQVGYSQPGVSRQGGYAPRDVYADRRGYDPRCFAESRRDDTAATVGGAVAGAVVGGVAGTLIGGNTAGTLIGGGLGAVAGGVAGRELSRAEGSIGPCPDYDPQTRGYGRAPIAGTAPGTQVIGYLPGPTTTTTITFDDGSTVTTYEDGEE